MEEKRIIEINGVKLELDLRQASVQQIDTFKVGDSVKVLIKDGYGETYKSCAGVITGFDAFQKLPTIIIAYLHVEYNEAKLKFVYLNAQSTDLEVCAASENDVPFERDQVLALMDKEIVKKETELGEARRNKEMFLSMFNRYFADYAKVAEQINAL